MNVFESLKFCVIKQSEPIYDWGHLWIHKRSVAFDHLCVDINLKISLSHTETITPVYLCVKICSLDVFGITCWHINIYTHVSPIFYRIHQPHSTQLQLNRIATAKSNYIQLIIIIIIFIVVGAFAFISYLMLILLLLLLRWAVKRQ